MDLSFLLTRDADLAVLGVRLHGFDPPAAGAPGPPTAMASAADSCIVLVLPPQHIAEETTAAAPAANLVARAELSGTSRIAYAVPSGTGVPLTAAGVLAACVDLKPGGGSPVDTSVELPWRLAFGPSGPGVHTRHADQPIASAGRVTGLWLTRFGTAGRRGPGREGSALRLVPLDGALADGPDTAFPAPLTRDDRNMIAAMAPAPPAASRLELTPLGGSLSAAGSLPGFRWAQRTALGRDQAVRVEERLQLYPFGFAAVLTVVTERDPDATTDGIAPLAPGQPLALRRTTTLRLDETVRETPDGAAFSRTFPFGRIEVTTAVFGGLGDPVADYVAKRPTPDVQELRDQQGVLRVDQEAQYAVWSPFAGGPRTVDDLIRAGNGFAVQYRDALAALAADGSAQAEIADLDAHYNALLDQAEQYDRQADKLDQGTWETPEGGDSAQVQELRALAAQCRADAQQYRVDPDYRARVAADAAQHTRDRDAAYAQIEGVLGTPRDVNDVVNLGEEQPDASAAAAQWLADERAIADLQTRIDDLQALQSAFVVTEWPMARGGGRLLFPVRLSRGAESIDVLMPMIMVKDFVLPPDAEFDLPAYASLQDPELPGALELSWAGPRVSDRHRDRVRADLPAVPPSVVSAGGALWDVVGSATPEPADAHVIQTMNIVASSVTLGGMFAPSLGRITGGEDDRWSMLVQLPELQQLAGPSAAAAGGAPDVATSAVVGFARDYLQNGEAAAVLFSAAEGIGIDFTKAADRSGGLAAMQLASDAISRELGPVQLDGLLSGDPRKMIGEAATLFGFKLQDLIASLPGPPAIVSELLDGETPVVRMAWQDVVLHDVLAFRTFPGPPGDERLTTLTLDIVSSTDRTTTDCTVSDFYLQFPFGGATPLIRLDFTSVKFHQETTYGADVGPDPSAHVTASPPKVTFSGFDITFLGPLEPAEDAAGRGRPAGQRAGREGHPQGRHRHPHAAGPGRRLRRLRPQQRHVPQRGRCAVRRGAGLGLDRLRQPRQALLAERALVRRRRVRRHPDRRARPADRGVAGVRGPPVGQLRGGPGRGARPRRRAVHAGRDGRRHLRLPAHRGEPRGPEGDLGVGRAPHRAELRLRRQAARRARDPRARDRPDPLVGLGRDRQRGVGAAGRHVGVRRHPSGERRSGGATGPAARRRRRRRPGGGGRAGEPRRAVRVAGLPRGVHRPGRPVSELILTCAPGVTLTADGGLLRVVIVPRLSGGGDTLASYGMTDWPARLAGAAFEVRLRAADGRDLPPAGAPIRSEASQDVWNGFFGGAIRVRPFAGQPVHPDPDVTQTSQHARDIDGAYATVVSRPDPRTVDAQLSSLTFPDPPPPPDLDAPVPATVEVDFHRAMALLREHPVVMRALGLIVELTVPRAALDACGGAGEVAVGWAGAPSTYTQVSCRPTAFVVSGGRFLAAPTALVVDGLVDLRATSPHERVQPDGTTRTVDRPDWTVCAIDVDGAMARLDDAKQAVTRARAAGTPIAEVAAMPALRTVGLQLVHRGRGDWMRDRAARGRGNATRAAFADGPALTAEDLMLGYRVDVRLAGNARWHSLTRRTGEYRVNGIPIGGGPHIEEGHVKPAAGVRGTDEKIRTDEVVVRWDGWHLGVARPDLEGAPARDRTPRHDLPYDFTWTLALDPTQPALPELRFDRSYQLRLRVVNIAGGGLALSDVPGDIGATPSTSYRRYEPVLPPEMPPPPGLLTIDDHGAPTVHDALLGPAGALDRLVVRSDPAGDGEVTGYPVNDSRLLLPPAAPFAVIEQHDRLNGSDEETWRLVRRALGVPQASAVPRNGRTYTWVPDPAADGVSVTALPLSARAAPTTATLSGWESDAWPDHQPKEVRVVPGALGGHLEANWATPDSAVVSVPPAMRATIEAASYVVSEFGKFAAVLWVAGVPAASDAVSNGRHPVITPARRIEVVHAVRRPLSAPAGPLAATREEGDTFARIAGAADPLIGVDRDSTAQLDVSATWDEWGDAPTPVAAGEVVGSIPVDLDAPALPPLHHEFADTKHREVTYRVVARSRFRDCFAATDPESAFVREGPPVPVPVPSTARPPAPVVVSAVPAFRWDLTPIFHIPGIDEPEDIGAAPPIDAWVHTRAGGLVRVELDGPWYATGAGEQLGVIVSPGPGADGLAGVAGAEGGIATAGGAGTHLVTTLYRDPLFNTGSPAQPDHTTMASTGGPAFVAVDREAQTRVCVVPYDVFYAAGRRFADISFAALADQSYCPQARLSLVRFQRGSLPLLEASAVVRTDIVPLLPTRTLRVDAPSGAPVVLLSGTGPGGAGNAVEVRLEAAPLTRVGDLTALDAGSTGGWSIVRRLTGALNVPFAPIDVPVDGAAHRLVVREFESIAPSSAVTPADALAAEHASRVVFADVLPL